MKQLFSQLLALLTALLLIGLIALTIFGINFLPFATNINLHIHLVDVLVGITIYLKTSIDFALFTGNLMAKFPGMKNGLAIEIGTALGNGLGTLLILVIWAFFKAIPLLLFVMILLASLVLLSLAEESIQSYLITSKKIPYLTSFVTLFYTLLKKVTHVLHPFLQFIIPHPPKNISLQKTFLSLFLFAITIPFILGLDDFAGYIPLFSIIHIFGFCVGVILGHFLLTVSLFAFPSKTIQLIRYPLIQLFGGFVFVGLSLFGILEAVKVILQR